MTAENLVSTLGENEKRDDSMTTQAAIQDPVRFLELYRKIEKNKSVEFFQHKGKPLLHIVNGRGVILWEGAPFKLAMKYDIGMN